MMNAGKGGGRVREPTAEATAKTTTRPIGGSRRSKDMTKIIITIEVTVAREGKLCAVDVHFLHIGPAKERRERGTYR